MEEIAAAVAAINLIEKLLPTIAKGVKAGQITPEQQQLVHDRYKSLRANGDAAFSGPEWQVVP